YGSIHRNTYLDSPTLLCRDLAFRQRPDLFCAGQLCGNEGYTESIATGHLAALAVLRRLAGKPWVPPPPETALGALLRHVTSSEEHPFTPSNIHFGLFPPLDTIPGKRSLGKKEKQERMCERAMGEIRKWVASLPL
ncbi:MAG: FAD-dependent oxidoreductase, partial [Chitinispirillaceae bacterium]|nr:FAD-dependent oxidoreductase [Chitinispirillaceae bacterium]